MTDEYVKKGKSSIYIDNHEFIVATEINMINGEIRVDIVSTQRTKLSTRLSVKLSDYIVNGAVQDVEFINAISKECRKLHEEYLEELTRNVAAVTLLDAVDRMSNLR
jgi:hypothetical protein